MRHEKTGGRKKREGEHTISITVKDPLVERWVTLSGCFLLHMLKK